MKKRVKKQKQTKAVSTGTVSRKTLLFDYLIAGAIILSLMFVPVLIERAVADTSSEETTLSSETASALTKNDDFSLKVESLAIEDVALPIELGESVYLMDIVSVDGTFPEDGENATAENMLGIVLENRADKTLQYLTASLSLGEENYHFSITSVPPGASVIAYDTAKKNPPETVGNFSTAVEHLVFFPQEPTCMEDKLRVTVEDGNLAVTNISGEDIHSELFIYYKTMVEDYYIGGITYRVRISDGIRAGETYQAYASHAYPTRTRIMFADVAA